MKTLSLETIPTSGSSNPARLLSSGKLDFVVVPFSKGDGHKQTDWIGEEDASETRSYPKHGRRQRSDASPARAVGGWYLDAETGETFAIIYADEAAALGFDNSSKIAASIYARTGLKAQIWKTRPIEERLAGS